MKKCSFCLAVSVLLLIFVPIVQAQDEAQKKWDDAAEAAVETLHLDTMFKVQRCVVDGGGCRMILTADGVTYVIRYTGSGRDAGDNLQGKVAYESGKMVIKYLGGGYRGIEPGSPVMHGAAHGAWRYNVVTARVLRLIR
jgi:hypothetical protein